MNTNIHLTELGHAKATWCKPISNFFKHYKQIRMREKLFSLKKIISLKHSGVRSYFEVFIEPNITVQSNFDFDTWFWNYDLFYFEIMRMDVLFLYLDTLLMGCCTTGLIFCRRKLAVYVIFTTEIDKIRYWQILCLAIGAQIELLNRHHLFFEKPIHALHCECETPWHRNKLLSRFQIPLSSRFWNRDNEAGTKGTDPLVSGEITGTKGHV